LFRIRAYDLVGFPPGAPVVNSVSDGLTLRGAVTGFILSGGAIWVAGLLRWRMAPPLLRRVFLAGVFATIPILVVATPQDAGRYWRLDPF
jgi:hypothetical protein